LSGEFTEDGTCIYKHNLKVGKIDILFVVDNSKSMYKEQLKMADRFPTFIESIAHMDYQIAIMTTDITKDPVRSGQFVIMEKRFYLIVKVYLCMKLMKYFRVQLQDKRL